MARASDQSVPPLGPWPRGSNNVAREDSVPRGSYRQGVNVDTYPGGKLRRREGTTRVDDTPTENLWSDGSYALCTSAGALYKFTPGAPLQQLHDGLAPYADVSYAVVNQFVYVSDGVKALRVNMLTNEVTPWGVETPAGQPTLLASSGGGLDAGTYQVAITYARTSGEESGTQRAATITVADGGGIALTNIPQPSDVSVAHVNVYVTRSNGESLLYYGSIGVGILSTQLYKQNLGNVLETMLLAPMPAGRNPVFAGGRLYVTVDSLLVWSEPFRFGLFNPRLSFTQYASQIQLVAPTLTNSAINGLFVAASESTFFLAGEDPQKWAQNRVYHASAVPGSLVYVPGAMFRRDDFPTHNVPVWLATNGYICVGLPNGTIAAVTEGRFAASVGVKASSFFRDMRGIPHVVFAMPSPTSASQAVASDTVDSILIRNGITQ